MRKCLPGLCKTQRSAPSATEATIARQAGLGRARDRVKLFSLPWIQAVLMHGGMISAWLRVPGKLNKMTHVKVTAQHLA